MTVIAWKEHGDSIELAADSLISEGDMLPPFGPSKKIFNERGLVIAASGYSISNAHIGALVIGHAQELAVGKKLVSDQDWPGIDVVVLAREGAFLVNEFQFYRLPWEAIGSGAGYARGYMIGGLSPKEAVSRVIERRMDRHCGGQTQSTTVNRQDLTSLESLGIYPAT